MIEVYYAEDDEVIGKSVKEYLEQQNCKVAVFAAIADIRQALDNHLGEHLHQVIMWLTPLQLLGRLKA